MLYKSKDYFHVSCDACPEAISLETQFFMEAIATIKELGWTTLKLEDKYIHHCPDCRGEPWD